MEGRIIKQISNQYTVQVNNNYYTTQARGKFRNIGLSPLVGDIVEINPETLTIEKIKPRINELARPVVANIDIALIVTSLKNPNLSLSLLDKQISIIKARHIEPVICFTKMDLLNSQEKKDIKKLKKYYTNLNIKIVDNRHLGHLKRVLKDKLVCLTGQTGAGKSSLLNKLDKRLNLETNPISKALNRGVHTTRHTEIYQIGKIYFCDTPGFSALDFQDITKEELRDTFVEFQNYHCKFPDCFHQKEKGCEVIKDVGTKILPSRYVNYGRFLNECQENSNKLYK